MLREQWHSPLLHREIYREKAVHDALAWCHTTYRALFEVTTDTHGCRVILVDTGTFRGRGERLLREVMNMMLSWSLESRLEEMTSCT